MAYTYKPWTPNDETKKLEEKSNSFGEYEASDEVNGLLETYNTYKDNNNPGEWTGGTYGKAREDKYKEIESRPNFTYDLNGDALYQQYKDKYINQGRLAMADTIGQASAMTGGYGSSYATTAGSQAYQSHLQNLNDIVPQLYQMAYNKYTQEGEDLKAQYSMLSDMYNSEYGEHRDKVSDYNTNLDRYYSQYTDARNFDYGSWDADRTYYQNAYQNAYNRDYGAHMDNEDRLRQEHLDSIGNQGGGGGTVPGDGFKGLSFSESQIIDELYKDEDWGAISRYIMSLDRSDEEKAYLAMQWLPEEYRKLQTIPTQEKDKVTQYLTKAAGGVTNWVKNLLN